MTDVAIDAKAEAAAAPAAAAPAVANDSKAADATAEDEKATNPAGADSADDADAANAGTEETMKTEEQGKEAEVAGTGDEADAADAPGTGDAPEAAKKDGEPGASASTPAKAAAKPTSAASRRKSAGGQKLNRKASKARITHLDAKPGDHFFVKLKGYPAWPVIICDDEMLPETLLKSRPVSAARQDGTYREDYADGGKRAADRSFPVMYLYTNEFGWVPNQDMHDLDPSKVLEAVNDKMRKDLQHAHNLAAENNPLSHYKELLQMFKEEQEQAEEAKRLAAMAPKKTKKVAARKDADIDMLDMPMDDDDEASAPTPKKAASKKRKAEDDARTPQRSDSVKKPKIKITSSGTPKNAGANGTPSSSGKNAKPKSKKAAETSAAAPAAEEEANLTPEEKLRRKSKEVYFLRHRLQRSLLTDQMPKDEEMKPISEFLTTLEGFATLEATVIRETKINKVLKAILKKEVIPREEEFKFKPRSQALLEKWNKILAASPPPPEAEKAGKEKTNGASANSHGNSTEKGAKAANGVKEEATVEDGEKVQDAKEE